MPTVRKHFDLKGTVLQSLDDRNMAVNVDDLHGALLFLGLSPACIGLGVSCALYTERRLVVV